MSLQAGQGSHFWAERAFWAEQSSFVVDTIATNTKLDGLLLFSTLSIIDAFSLATAHRRFLFGKKKILLLLPTVQNSFELGNENRAVSHIFAQHFMH